MEPLLVLSNSSANITTPTRHGPGAHLVTPSRRSGRKRRGTKTYCPEEQEERQRQQRQLAKTASAKKNGANRDDMVAKTPRQQPASVGAGGAGAVRSAATGGSTDINTPAACGYDNGHTVAVGEAVAPSSVTLPTPRRSGRKRRGTKTYCPEEEEERHRQLAKTASAKKNGASRDDMVANTRQQPAPVGAGGAGAVRSAATGNKDADSEEGQDAGRRPIVVGNGNVCQVNVHVQALISQWEAKAAQQQAAAVAAAVAAALAKEKKVREEAEAAAAAALAKEKKDREEAEAEAAAVLAKERAEKNAKEQALAKEKKVREEAEAAAAAALAKEKKVREEAEAVAAAALAKERAEKNAKEQALAKKTAENAIIQQQNDKLLADKQKAEAGCLPPVYYTKGYEDQPFDEALSTRMHLARQAKEKHFQFTKVQKDGRLHSYTVDLSGSAPYKQRNVAAPHTEREIYLKDGTGMSAIAIRQQLVHERKKVEAAEADKARLKKQVAAAQAAQEAKAAQLHKKTAENAIIQQQNDKLLADKQKAEAGCLPPVYYTKGYEDQPFDEALSTRMHLARQAKEKHFQFTKVQKDGRLHSYTVDLSGSAPYKQRNVAAPHTEREIYLKDGTGMPASAMITGAGVTMKVRAPQICTLCTQAVHDKLLAHDALHWSGAASIVLQRTEIGRTDLGSGVSCTSTAPTAPNL
eukprot:COSAG01_NODE_7911_length_2996_cov_5.467380_2_plen_694_part_00